MELEALCQAKVRELKEAQNARGELKAEKTQVLKAKKSVESLRKKLKSSRYELESSRSEW